MKQETRATILVVDDDRLARLTTVSGLRDRGYCVVEAESAEEALAQAQDSGADLALLDIKMDGMSGIELAEVLRDRVGIPAMFLSAYDDALLVHQANVNGALGYLVKPIDPSRMIPAIETALARSQELAGMRSVQARMEAELAAAREVSIATGILLERKGTSREAAYDMLRRHARSQRRKLREVASDIVRAAEILDLD
jgi:response regulator NasT